jgi:hypothetical protein
LNHKHSPRSAEREVLVSDGVINSPHHQLMLSGIGEPAQIRKHHINVRLRSASTMRERFTAPC